MHPVWRKNTFVTSDQARPGGTGRLTRTTPPPGAATARRREILALALPSLGALVAEPLFLLADSAIVGHLGTAPLAALALASTLLQTTVGLCIFLAYTTTATVSRLIGAGRRGPAVRAGVDGVWLAALLGTGLAVVGWFAAPTLVAGFAGDHPELWGPTADYLRWSVPGLPAMLVVLAATGLLRGLQDARTPLVVTVVALAANAVLNWVLVYPAGLGLRGSALGTTVCQWGMAAAYLAVAARLVRSAGVRPWPEWGGVLRAGYRGWWLVLRTATLRVALLGTVLTATGLGVRVLAAHQAVYTVYTLACYVLDALGIAGQALTGRVLGAGDAPGARAVLRTMSRWGAAVGVVMGVLVAVAAPWAGWLFGRDPAVVHDVAVASWVMAAGLPLAGWVFMLDGALIGAGDARYLAVSGLAIVVVYLPLLALLGASSLAGAAALGALWLVFHVGFMGTRAVTLGLRARGTAWMRLGA